MCLIFLLLSIYFFSSVPGAETSFVVNTDIYSKEKTISVSSSKSGPVIAKREVKKVSIETYLFIFRSNNHYSEHRNGSPLLIFCVIHVK